MALRTADQGARPAMLAGGAVPLPVLAAAVLAVAVLAACAEQSGPAPPGRTARLPDEGFFLDSNADEGLKLAYGRDGTDDVTLMLECLPGSRKIDVIFFDSGLSGGGHGPSLTLTSGRVGSTLSTVLETNEAGEGAVVTAHATPDLPALNTFRRTGLISGRLRSEAFSLTATVAERAEIARFFSGCEKR